jgi:hypothetical protein
LPFSAFILTIDHSSILFQISDSEHTLESLRFHKAQNIRFCNENFSRCIKIVDNLIGQHIEVYSSTTRTEQSSEILLLIRGLWMLRQHPQLFVRKWQWDILLILANDLSDIE